MGKLADLIGRRAVLILGTVLEAVGGGIAAFASDHLAITIGIFLVGLGWCAANVASTAIVIDTTPIAVRGRAIGMTDTIAAVAGVAFPLCVGPMVEAWGLGSTGILAVALMLPPGILFVSSGPISPHAGEGSAAAPAVYGG
jgi:MFS family permease